MKGVSDRAEFLIIAGFHKDVAVTIADLDKDGTLSDDEVFRQFCEIRLKQLGDSKQFATILRQLGFEERACNILQPPTTISTDEWLSNYLCSIRCRVDGLPQSVEKDQSHESRHIVALRASLTVQRQCLVDGLDTMAKIKREREREVINCDDYETGRARLEAEIATVDKELNKLARPVNYEKLSPENQWTIDKRLGILDWDGK